MMPVRIFTPNRALIIIITAAFVSTINFVLNSEEPEFASYEEYFLNKILSGSVKQDDRLLIAWVKDKIQPPSQLPYKIAHRFSGIYTGEKEEGIYSPSQDFILSKVEELLGTSIEKGGTFLEAGAYDGEFLSNTLSLEYSYGWKGILVEPHPTFYKQLLAKNRKSWAINACLNDKPWPSQEIFYSVYGDTSTNHLLNGLVTNATIERDVNLASSGLAKYADIKHKVEEKFLVQCLPLYTILKAAGMTHVDFLSLDVEGAAMGILDTLPWDKVSFSILSIEHNSMEELRNFLRPKGYIHFESESGDHIFVNKRNKFRIYDPAPSQKMFTYLTTNYTTTKNTDFNNKKHFIHTNSSRDTKNKKFWKFVNDALVVEKKKSRRRIRGKSRKREQKEKLYAHHNA